MDRNAVRADPSVGAFAKPFAACADTLGVEVAVGVLPSALEYDVDLGRVVAFELFLLAEARGVDPAG